MYGPRCEYCRHFNHPGAKFCEACEFPLETDTAAGEPPRAGVWAAHPSAVDTIPAPPFKGAGDVISPMLAVYRKHFTLVGLLVLAIMVPEALVRYGVVDFTRAGAMLAGAGVGFTSLRGWFIWLLGIAATSLLSGSLVYAVVDLQRTGRASAGESLARGLKALPTLFPLTLLYTVITILGYALLLVPGVILSLMFAVCVPAAVLEGRGPVGALKRSAELTKGYKGLIFITTFLWAVVIIALNWLLVWSFARGAKLDLLPALLLQTAVLGMLNSSLHVLTVYVYLGLLRERANSFRNRDLAQGAGAAAG